MVVRSQSNQANAKEEDFWDGYISDDDPIEEGEDKTCFSMGMTREEKTEARRPWRNGLIIKLIGRYIGYHYLWRGIQAMWRTQGEPMLIDLGYDFFIVKLSRQEEYDRALLEGPWIVGGPLDDWRQLPPRPTLETELCSGD